ncbi:MAG TPA: hypothetical protein PLW09_06285 [Candidatus Kapabacteria bacterium]|jgi:hypothetical protein|nr:hypothetical protein [Ignavibacteria bacterium]HRE57412.1 hypothetical protein [Candidatus Kapabacteria bacterium]HRI30543.1 hypothetical protein [Candidatus Kapabacteria bacterium]
MDNQISSTKLLFGLTIFIGLMPLTFTFSQNGTQLLLNTSLKYVVWCGQLIILLVLLLTKPKLSKNQLVGLSMLFALIPFAFTFNGNGLTFLILNKYTSSILSWAIASALLSKMLINTNFKPGH